MSTFQFAMILQHHILYFLRCVQVFSSGRLQIFEFKNPAHIPSVSCSSHGEKHHMFLKYMPETCTGLTQIKSHSEIFVHIGKNVRFEASLSRKDLQAAKVTQTIPRTANFPFSEQLQHGQKFFLAYTFLGRPKKLVLIILTIIII